MGSKWANAIFSATKLLAHSNVAASRLTNGSQSDFPFTAVSFGAGIDPLVRRDFPSPEDLGEDP
jgi:hypothetical protein